MVAAAAEHTARGHEPGEFHSQITVVERAPGDEPEGQHYEQVEAADPAAAESPSVCRRRAKKSI
jgi:hypothetical protein